MIRGAILGLLTLLASGSVASAQRDAIFEPLPRPFDWRTVAKSDSLHFSLIPHGKTNIVFAWGGISPGDALRFSAALSAAKPIDEIQIYSGGGSLGEGLKIGYLIHRGGFSTRVPNGARCVSACNFIFMGGIVRSIDPSGSFEVHMFSDDSTQRLRAELIHPPRSVSEFNRHHPNAAIDPDGIDDRIAAANARMRSIQGNENRTGADDKNEPMDGSVPVVSAAPPLAAATNGSRVVQQPGGVTLDDLLINYAIDDDVKGIQQSSAQIAAVIARYLVEMQLSLDFLTTFADIPNSTPRPLTRAELIKFNVINN